MRRLFTEGAYFCLMRFAQALLTVGILLAQPSQRVKAVFGLLEGTPARGAGFYKLVREPSGAQITLVDPLYYGGGPLDPYGNDLVYDPRTKYLFLIGGGPNFSTYRGVLYGMDVWHGLILDSLTGPIGARRLAVKDTLLLVTRNQPPFFTAYRIRPTATGIALDSLWSPPSVYLRSVPEAIVVVGDTAFIPLSYHPNTYAADSLILTINLRTQQVDSFCKVYPNPAELLRIGSKLYAACYGDYTTPLHIAAIDIPSRTVNITNANVTSFGGFVTDTGGRDTILFVDAANALRAYATTTQQVATSPYQGIQAVGGLNLYGLLWTGDWLIPGYTNYMDTSIIVLIERGQPFMRMDTIRTGIPSPRRFIYVEEDPSVLSTIQNAPALNFVQLYPNPASNWVWIKGAGIQEIGLRDLLGRHLHTWKPCAEGYDLSDLPSGLYLVQVKTGNGLYTLRLQKL